MGMMKPIVLKSIDQTLEEYRHHLTHTAGAANATCKCWTFYVRQFLEAHFKEANAWDWSTVTAQVLLQYFLEKSRHYLPRRLQSAASALRSFIRFLCLSSRCSEDLALGIPRIGSPQREELPDYLSEEQPDRLLKSAHESPSGLRDYAIVICLARLGLRAGEVARLALDHLDWREGMLTLARTKGRRERRLPLPADVGTAIVKYLRQARPATPSRQLFVSVHRAEPMSAGAISRVVATGLKRAGIVTPRRGAHLLRRPLASHLVQRGVNLKNVADLLGHSSLNSTRVDAKLNLPVLQQLAMPWPMEAAR